MILASTSDDLCERISHRPQLENNIKSDGSTALIAPTVGGELGETLGQSIVLVVQVGNLL